MCSSSIEFHSEPNKEWNKKTNSLIVIEILFGWIWGVGRYVAHTFIYNMWKGWDVDDDDAEGWKEGRHKGGQINIII